MIFRWEQSTWRQLRLWSLIRLPSACFGDEATVPRTSIPGSLPQGLKHLGCSQYVYVIAILGLECQEEPCSWTFEIAEDCSMQTIFWSSTSPTQHSCLVKTRFEIADVGDIQTINASCCEIRVPLRRVSEDPHKNTFLAFSRPDPPDPDPPTWTPDLDLDPDPDGSGSELASLTGPGLGF